MKQKLTLLFLCFAMVLTLCTFFTFGASAEGEVPVPDTASKWDGSVADGFASGSGVEGDPYIIETAAQLAYWKNNAAAYATAYIELAADLNLQNTNFSSISTFSGNFDGKGHTIYNFSTTSKAFIQQASCTIVNVNFANATVNAPTSSDVAVLVGRNVGTLKISECEFYNCKVTGSGNTAIVVGYNYKGTVTVKDVVIDKFSSVTASTTAAAFVASSSSTGTMSFENCVNYASVTVSGDQAAGFNAYSYDSNTTYKNCFNYGSIKAGTYAGGFVGQRTRSNTNANFYNCANYGKIEATTDAAAGFIAYSTTNTNGGVPVFTNSANYGNIVSAGKAGGILGYAAGGICVHMDGCLAVGIVQAGDGTSPAFAHTWADRSNTSTRGAWIKHFYYVGEMWTSLTTSSSTKKENNAIYSDATLESLNNFVTANSTDDLVLTDWVHAPLPDNSVNYPQLSNAPHLQNASTQEYTVTFVDFYGEVIDVQTVKENYDADISELPVPEVEGYKFIGWEETYKGITADVTVSPIYKKIYTVSFYNMAGFAISTQDIVEGEAALAPADPVEEGYTFTGWDKAFDNVTTNLDVYPTFTIKSFTVTFLDKAGNVFATETVEYGASATAPVLPPITGFVFIGWDVEFDEITGDLTVKPVYSEVSDLFAGGDGSENAPFVLATEDDLYNLAKYVNGSLAHETLTADQFIAAHYMLANDIDLGGKEWTPIKNITGSFNGNNKTISNFSVDGSDLNGFFKKATGKIENLSLYNVDMTGASTNNRGMLVGEVGAGELLIDNCHVHGNLIGGNSVGGFVGLMQTEGGDLKVKNSSVSGSIKGKDFTGGIFGKRTRGSFYFENCTNYATVTASGYAGGLFGGSASGTGAVYDKVIGNLSLGTVKALEGKGGALVGYLGARSGKTHKASHLYYVGTPIGTVDSAAPTVTFTNCAELSSVTALNELPESIFSRDLWTIGTVPMVSGVSVTLGNSISLNVYAKVAIVFAAHQIDGLYVNGAFVTAGEEATVGGALYTKYVFDSFELTDMDEALALSLIDGDTTQKTYAITTYLANTYKNYAENANLVALVEAIALYGNAAQLADEQEPTVLNSFVAAAGIELPEDYSFEAYVAEKFRTVNLKTNNTSAAGMGINLSGTIDPIFYVADGITKVEVEIYGKTTTIEVVEGVAQFYGLNATSLNNTMQVTFYAGDDVVSTQRTSVACYIEDALAREGFLTDGQAVLAQALAVYMRAARDYMGLN